MNIRDAILNLLDSPKAAYSQSEILKQLGLPRSLRRRLDDVLGELLDKGLIKENREHRYMRARKEKGGQTYTGRLSLSSRGAGFVAVQGLEEDLYVPQSYLGWALPGDEVEVRLLPPQKPSWRERGRSFKERQAAEVLQVLQRGRLQWVGRLGGSRQDPLLRVREGDLEIDIPLYNVPSHAKEEDWLVAEAPEAQASDGREPKAKALSLLEGSQLSRLDTLILVKKADLRESFPRDVLKEAEAISPEVRAQDIEGRLDLRSQTVFTIDGADAKDFDDAVSIEPMENGGFRLGVHIADVGYYVKIGSPLDQEAYKRGTSTYLPDRVLPMLPEALSNGICSLKEGVDRLTMSAMMDFDSAGNMKAARFADSVICSSKRFTYDLVQDVLDKKTSLEGAHGKVLTATLLQMQNLAEKMIQQRFKRGALDFDFPEVKVEMDDKGEVTRLYRRPRLFAHRLIEEFMLAANEAVAKELGDKKIPLLYRIHEEPEPEKLADTMTVLAKFKLGMPLGSPVQPKSIQKILLKAQGRPEERLVNTLLLRSLKLARYSPHNAGHFGLALEDYCHFTSPIRRYPDLVVHRMLRRGLTSGRGLKADEAKELKTQLVTVGEVCSTNERKAESCERDCVKAKQIRYLEKHLGKHFQATITSVTTFGFFAEIDEFPAEGLVHVRSLVDDVYSFDMANHCLRGDYHSKVFSIGDKVMIRVERADWEALKADFAIVED